MEHTWETVTAIADPVARYEAAKAAREVQAAQWRRVELGAMRQLKAELGTSKDAGAALGISRAAVDKALEAGAPADLPLGPVSAPPEPALYFATPGEAEDALLDLQLRQQDIDDQNPHFLLGALAAGVDPVAVSALSRKRLSDIRRMRPAGNIPVSRLGPDSTELIEDFARLVSEHAATLNVRAATTEERHAARIWHFAAEAIVTNVAPDFLATPDGGEPAGNPDELATVSGPDAWLAAQCTSYTRLAGEGRPQPEGSAEASQGARRAYTEIRDAIRHLRTTGTLPVLNSGEGE